MTFEQYITAANIIERLVVTDAKASDLLFEALGYQRKANSFNDLENAEAQQYNGYYRDTMRRCANRIVTLTGLDRIVVCRALATVVSDLL